jgi:hypothetical protein
MAAADGALRRLVANNEPVPGDRADRVVEHQLRARVGARGDLIGAEDGDPAGHVGGAQMNVHRRPVAQRAHLGVEHAQIRVDFAHRPQIGRRHQPIAALYDRLVDAGEIDGAALPGCALIGFLIVGVDPAYPRFLPRLGQRQVAADVHTAAKHGARRDQAGAGDGKGTVDSEPEVAMHGPFAGLGRDRRQVCRQCLDAVAGDGGDREDRRFGQGRRRQDIGDRGGDVGNPVGIDPVDLGQRDHAMTHAEQIEDRQMLAGLRHRPVVGGDHQKRVIDPGHPGQHVADEALMARHIDEAKHRAIGQRVVGEAQVDRHAALLFLRQAVGVDAGERLHQQRLAVVDMAGGGDDHGDGALRRRFPPPPRPSPIKGEGARAAFVTRSKVLPPCGGGFRWGVNFMKRLVALVAKQTPLHRRGSADRATARLRGPGRSPAPVNRAGRR